TSFVPSFLVCSPHQAIRRVTSSLSPPSSLVLSLFSTSLLFELLFSLFGSLLLSLPPHAANHTTITSPRAKSNVLFILFFPLILTSLSGVIISIPGMRFQYTKQV